MELWVSFNPVLYLFDLLILSLVPFLIHEKLVVLCLGFFGVLVLCPPATIYDLLRPCDDLVTPYDTYDSDLLAPLA